MTETVVVVVVVNHQHRGRWLGLVHVPSLQTSCCSGTGAVVGGAVALKVCGCEPSAQRPVVGSGPGPSAADKLLFRCSNTRSCSIE